VVIRCLVIQILAPPLAGSINREMATTSMLSWPRWRRNTSKVAHVPMNNPTRDLRSMLERCIPGRCMPLNCIDVRGALDAIGRVAVGRVRAPW
jgi:hypothetical protein